MLANANFILLEIRGSKQEEHSAISEQPVMSVASKTLSKNARM